MARAYGASSFKDGSLYDMKEEQDGVYVARP